MCFFHIEYDKDCSTFHNIGGIKTAQKFLVPGGFHEDAAEWVETICVSSHFAQHPLAAVFGHHTQKVKVEVQFLQTLPYLKHKP